MITVLIISLPLAIIWFVRVVKISHIFEDKKIIYDSNIIYDSVVISWFTTLPLRVDCKMRGGNFKICGTVCEPAVNICIPMCANTCEFKN